MAAQVTENNNIQVGNMPNFGLTRIISVIGTGELGQYQKLEDICGSIWLFVQIRLLSNC